MNNEKYIECPWCPIATPHEHKLMTCPQCHGDGVLPNLQEPLIICPTCYGYCKTTFERAEKYNRGLDRK